VNELAKQLTWQAVSLMRRSAREEFAHINARIVRGCNRDPGGASGAACDLVRGID
jgi:hypothetical protein